MMKPTTLKGTGYIASVRGILEGYGTSPPDPPITPNLLGEVGV
jgi:hypothetical protein